MSNLASIQKILWKREIEYFSERREHKNKRK
jgi:hypothetical protein